MDASSAEEVFGVFCNKVHSLLNAQDVPVKTLVSELVKKVNALLPNTGTHDVRTIVLQSVLGHAQKDEVLWRKVLTFTSSCLLALQTH